jgi:putative endonuclease
MCIPLLLDPAVAAGFLNSIIRRPDRMHRLESSVPFVYLLRCGDGTLYAGAAKDLARRLAEHLAGKASRYTRTRLPVKVVWSLQVETWSDALREEMRLKGLSRAEKDELLRASPAPDRAAAAAPDEPPS